jgi:hypothetical protein
MLTPQQDSSQDQSVRKRSGLTTAVAVLHHMAAVAGFVLACCRLELCGLAARRLVTVDVGLIAVPTFVLFTIGVGLMQRRKWARRAALILSGGFGFVVSSCMFVGLLAPHRNTEISWPSHPSGQLVLLVFLVASIAAVFSFVILIRKKCAAEFSGR